MDSDIVFCRFFFFFFFFSPEVPDVLATRSPLTATPVARFFFVVVSSLTSLCSMAGSVSHFCHSFLGSSHSFSAGWQSPHLVDNLLINLRSAQHDVFNRRVLYPPPPLAQVWRCFTKMIPLSFFFFSEEFSLFYTILNLTNTLIKRRKKIIRATIAWSLYF